MNTHFTRLADHTVNPGSWTVQSNTTPLKYAGRHGSPAQGWGAGPQHCHQRLLLVLLVVVLLPPPLLPLPLLPPLVVVVVAASTHQTRS